MLKRLKTTAAAALLLLFGGLALVQPGYAGDVDVRVYDREHRDYHHWNSGEDRVYRSYLEERHQPYREFKLQHREHQRAYWNWRHEHGDR